MVMVFHYFLVKDYHGLLPFNCPHFQQVFNYFEVKAQFIIYFLVFDSGAAIKVIMALDLI